MQSPFEHARDAAIGSARGASSTLATRDRQSCDRMLSARWYLRPKGWARRALILLFLEVLVGVLGAHASEVFVFPDRDAFVADGAQGTNYGSETYLDVGWDYCTTRHRERIFLHFDLVQGGIPQGSTITAASLNIYFQGYQCASNQGNHTLEVYRASGTWSEAGVNWTNQPGLAQLLIATAPIPNTPVSYGISGNGILNTVQGWSTSPTSNDGFGLRDTKEAITDAGTLRFRSKEAASLRPYLQVSFVPPPCTPPGTPTPTSPSCGTSMPTQGSVTLAWSAATNATSYDLEGYNGDACSGTLALNVSISGTSYVWNNPGAGAHAWRVRARNNDHPSPCTPESIGAWSSCCGFRFTEPCLTPGTPTALSPACGSTVAAGDVTLSWAAATNATSYDYELYGGESCAGTPLLAGNTGATSLVWTHPGPGTHAWRVRARNNAHPSQCTPEAVGAWTGCCSFVVPPPCTVPPVPTLIRPLCLSVTDSSRVDFEWAGSSEATSYDYEVYLGSSCVGTPVLSGNTTATQVIWTDAPSDHVAAWRVRARNTSHPSACSPEGVSDWVPCCPFNTWVSDAPQVPVPPERSRLVVTNPYRPGVPIYYLGPPSPSARLLVYDSSGRILRALSGSEFTGGTRFAWDGRASSGRAAVSGIYYVRLEERGMGRAKKLLLLE